MKRIFLILSLVFAAAASAPAQAALLEFPVDGYTNRAFPYYTASGSIRTLENGGIYTFDSGFYPVAPSSAIFLIPSTPVPVLVRSEQIESYNNQVCFFSICGGARVYSDVRVYDLHNPLSLSLEGQVNANTMTALGNPVPETASIQVQIVVDTHVQLLGTVNSLPDLLKDPIISLANSIANQLGDGTITVNSSITGFDPTEVNALINETLGIREITIDWNDILLYYSTPNVDFNGTVTTNTLSTVLGYFGLSTDDLIRDQLLGTIPDSWACPPGSAQNCLAYPGESLTFAHTLNTLPPSPNSTIPEPATLCLLGTGLFALGFKRKK